MPGRRAQGERTGVADESPADTSAEIAEPRSALGGTDRRRFVTAPTPHPSLKATRLTMSGRRPSSASTEQRKAWTPRLPESPAAPARQRFNGYVKAVTAEHVAPCCDVHSTRPLPVITLPMRHPISADPR